MDCNPPSRSAKSIKLSAVYKSYRLGPQHVVEALRSVDLEVAAESSVAITGPSGSGKSTLLHIIGAIDRPDSGTVEVGLTDLAPLSRRALADYRSTVGFIFQQFHLVQAFTALDNVVAPLVGRRVSFDRHDRALALLKAVGLEGRERSLPSQLSGGQQQRLAIARALINNPGVIIADEPTGSLDSAGAHRLIHLLESLRAAHHFTLVMATHNPTVARSCQRIVTMKDGLIEQEVSCST